MKIDKTRIALAVSSAMFAGASIAAGEPNVIYVMVDNWGYGDISANGGDVATPEIDKVAQEGILFQNYNVQNQSTPSRSAMHTGRLPIRSGTYKVPIFKGQADGLAPWEYTIAELLSDSGYKTALYGKWHVGSVDGRLPIDQGYDDWYGYRNGSNDAGFTSTKGFDSNVAEVPYVWKGVKGGKPEKVMPFDKGAKRAMDGELIDMTIAFMKKSQKENKPFYTYVGLTSFHSPMKASKAFDGKSGKGIYQDTQLEVDYQIGRLVDALRESGELDNTILVIAGDNASGNALSRAEGGVGILDTEKEPVGSNKPWRGGLSTAYEGGMRTPAMIRYGDKIKGAQVTNEIISDLDWFSTLAHMTGNEGKIPTDRPIDSINQADFMLGVQDKSSREYVLTYVNKELFAVKWRDFKMHFKTADETHGLIKEYTFPLVYDLSEDPEETNEIWANEGFQHSWLTEPVGRIILEKAISMKKYPNIETGQDFKGYIEAK